MLFRELKAKKAKFGFEAAVRAETFIPIAEAVKLAMKEDKNLLFDVSGYTSQNYAKIYTNVESAAKLIRSF